MTTLLPKSEDFVKLEIILSRKRKSTVYDKIKGLVFPKTDYFQSGMGLGHESDFIK